MCTRPELAKNINADEAAAMGAVYQAANLGKGFKVKAFLIRDYNIYPIQVQKLLLPLGIYSGDDEDDEEEEEEEGDVHDDDALVMMVIRMILMMLMVTIKVSNGDDDHDGDDYVNDDD